MSNLGVSLENFENLTKDKDEFLNLGKLTDQLKTLLKDVYDRSLIDETEFISKNALPELIVQGFDEEQIWQELELQNEDVLPLFIKKASRLLVTKELCFPVKLGLESCSESQVKTSKKAKKPVFAEQEAFSSEEEEEDELENTGELEQDESAEENIDGEESDFDEESIPKTNTKPVKIVPSEVDDEFFKLSEMEAFVLNEESKEDSNAVSGYDFFDPLLSDSEDEGKRPKYDDFFGDSERKNLDNQEFNEEEDFGSDLEGYDSGEKEYEGGEDEKVKDKKTKKVSFDILKSNQEDPLDEDDPSQKSSFQKREERLRERITELEDNALAEKSWTMKGEVNAEVRPVNSLLEEFVEFDMTQRPAPVITEETTNCLEDIIRQRIKDKAFDDVERKIKPVAVPLEYKKKLVLDQEKSKLSLAEVYEQEYLKQKAALKTDETEEKEEVEPEEHKKIKLAMKELFRKLDALGDYYFVPRPALSELTVVTKASAVTVEEVAPVTATDASLVAPEEVAGKFKKKLIAKEERTKTEKKSERRKKKAHQAKKFKAQSKKEQGKQGTYEEQLKKVMKFRNVSKLKESGEGDLKNSMAFFSKLQDKKIDEPKKRKRTVDTTAKKMKF